MIKFCMRIFSLVALSASVLFLLINSTFAGNQTKVGFVYLTTPGDHGWTYAHELGKQMVEKRFGDDVKISVVENVPEGPDLSLIHI